LERVVTADETRRWDEWQRECAEDNRRTAVHMRLVGIAILTAAIVNLAAAVWLR
jgi:hypothetical protein